MRYSNDLVRTRSRAKRVNPSGVLVSCQIEDAPAGAARLRDALPWATSEVR